MAEYLLGDSLLSRHGSSVSIGGRALIPHKGSLNEAVELLLFVCLIAAQIKNGRNLAEIFFLNYTPGNVQEACDTV